MASNTYLDVNGKKVNTDNLTYEDLIMLSKQFFDKTGEYPDLRNSKSANNLPTHERINEILLKAGKTRLDYLSDLGCNNNKILSRYMTEEQRNLKFFPFVLSNNMTLFYYKSDEPQSINVKWVHVHDQDGFMYYTTRALLQHNKKYNTYPHKFNFQNKRYLKYNMNRFLELNHANIRVTNVPDEATTVNDQIEFQTASGILYYNSWYFVRKHFEIITDSFVTMMNSYYLSRDITVENAKQIVYDKYKQLGRPLVSSDFIYTDSNSISQSVIKKIWGSFKNMCIQLQIPYVYNETLKYNVYKNSRKEIVKYVCDSVKSTGRDIITTRDFDNADIPYKYQSLKRLFESNGECIADFIQANGCTFQKSGVGMNYVFQDGEKVYSSYEYDFSTLLRSFGFCYNDTYFRDVPYSLIDKGYNGNMNCDYLIKYNGKTLFVELAGYLSDTKHIQAYYNNETISIKSKDQYRLKLYEKEKIFKDNDIPYQIILNPNLNINYYIGIINDIVGGE